MNSRHFKGALLALITLTLPFFITTAASADTAFEGEKTTDKLKFGGDFRLRHESLFNKSAGQVDRNRERYRMRFGVTGQLQDLTVGLRLASGTGEQVSTNQTFGNSFSQKGIFIDQAYLQWKTFEWLRLTGGRMPNPFWRTYSSDIMWDADINPEGYAEQVELPVGDRLSLFGNFAQLPVREISGSNNDPWMFGNQLGGTFKATEDVRVRLGVANYAFLNERKNALIDTSGEDFDPAIQEGNTRVSNTNPQLAQAFNIMDVTAELTFHAFTLPVSIQGDYVKNTAKSNPSSVSGQDKGYQYGAILGKAKNAGTAEFGYFYKYAEANCVLSDFADSDFGNGGTNRKGHILWLAYALRDNLTLQGKYFMTRRLNPMLNTASPYNVTTTNGLRDINRFQLDLVAKF